MKRLLVFVFAMCCVVFFSVQKKDTTLVTTYYLIRHAEKDTSDKSNKNPNLTSEGELRAKNWSKVFQDISFDAIYSTNYNRTLQTATPTAESQGISIETYDPRALNYKDFNATNAGKTVLIIGHSNTTPMFVNAILGTKKYDTMDEHDNGSLYIVTIIENNIIDQVLKIN